MVVTVEAGRLRREVEDVGDDHAVQAATLLERFLSQRVDNGVIKPRQIRRELTIEKAAKAVRAETLALPIKVVVVSQSRESGFHQKLGEGLSQRQLHRHGEGILHNEVVNGELIDEAPQRLLELLGAGGDVGYERGTFAGAGKGTLV